MPILAIDIGGTSIKSALCSGQDITQRRETPTDAHLGGEHLVATVDSIISSYLSGASGDAMPEAIGISTAGQVDPVRGRIIYANENIPGYTGTPLKDIFEARFGVRVAVENDVNAAAIGESVFGAGKGETTFLCLTYGTGIGGAIFMNGELQHGSSCSAGEFGALITHPEERKAACSGNAGAENRDFFAGCYEKYASAQALIRMAAAVDPSISDGRTLFARSAEPALQAVLDRWLKEVVLGLASLVHMFNPSCIVLGGGIMEQPDLPGQIEALLLPQIMPSFRKLSVKKAVLGNNAGLLGAAALAVSQRERDVLESEGRFESERTSL